MKSWSPKKINDYKEDSIVSKKKALQNNTLRKIGNLLEKQSFLKIKHRLSIENIKIML